MSTWEERMAEKAKARADAEKAAIPDADPLPESLAAELPVGATDDKPRHWCSRCGLADAPMGDHFTRTPPCPDCGSTWRWFGRVADLDGTATAPPIGQCNACHEWRRYSEGQKHFGWYWCQTCSDPNVPDEWYGCRFGHDHHKDEVWLA